VVSLQRNPSYPDSKTSPQALQCSPTDLSLDLYTPSHSYPPHPDISTLAPIHSTPSLAIPTLSPYSPSPQASSFPVNPERKHSSPPHTKSSHSVAISPRKLTSSRVHGGQMSRLNAAGRSSCRQRALVLFEPSRFSPRSVDSNRIGKEAVKPDHGHDRTRSSLSSIFHA